MSLASAPDAPRIEFSQPVRQISLMVAVAALVGFVISLIYAQLRVVFDANPFLNGFILFVFVIGVLACFRQVFTLISSVSWLEGFAVDRPGHEFVEPPRLLSALASLLRDRRARQALTATSSRSILDSVAQRLDEQRDITRYITNLLIFVGLLGTFWGLSQVVPGIVETIGGLMGSEEEDSLAVFNDLMAGLTTQLDGMGTAFASSLLGLGGSLVVGLLDLFAGHGQNRFYRELEEWLSSITRIGRAGASGSDDEDASGGAVVDALHGSAEQIEALVAAIKEAEARRADADARLDALAGAVQRMGRALEESAAKPAVDPELKSALNALADAQQRNADLLEAAAAKETDAEGGLRLRNIDLALARVLEEISAGRQDSTAEIRMDLARLTKAIMTATGQDGAPPPPPSSSAAR
ncbi:MAG: biopolymer transporter ExbB [Pseudomonadota bacterium]